MKKYTTEAKRSVLESGQLFEHTKARKEAFKGDRSQLNEFEKIYGCEVSKICKSIENSKYNKRKNIERRFNVIVASGNALFLTLTFDNDTLAKTSEETRRRYVARFLKEYCESYVANIDYGDKEKNPESNEREHYHALVMTKNENNRIESNLWQYGFSKIKAVHKSSKDVEKVSKYVAKLSQHALKKSTGLPRLIWSRGWKQFFKEEIVPDRLLPF